MAGRIYRTEGCIGYSPSALPIPALKIKLTDVTGEISREITFILDTGFEGDLLVKWEDYQVFRSAELPEELWRKYRGVSGFTITTRCAKALAEIQGLKLEVMVETPLIGETRNLAGRGLLNQLKIALDGPRKETCIIQEGK